MTGKDYCVGNLVQHPKWGLGRILVVQGDTVTVAFKEDTAKNMRRINVNVLPLEVAPITTDPVLDNVPSLEFFERGWRIGEPNYLPLWKAVTTCFCALTRNQLDVDPGESPYCKFRQLLLFPNSLTHFEWLLRIEDGQLDVALHAELKNLPKSLRWLQPVLDHQREIAADVPYRFDGGRWTNDSAHARFIIPYRYQAGTEMEIASVAAQTMKTFVERVTPILASVPAETQ